MQLSAPLWQQSWGLAARTAGTIYILPGQTAAWHKQSSTWRSGLQIVPHGHQKRTSVDSNFPTGSEDAPSVCTLNGRNSRISFALPQIGQVFTVSSGANFSIMPFRRFRLVRYGAHHTTAPGRLSVPARLLVLQFPGFAIGRDQGEVLHPCPIGQLTSRAVDHAISEAGEHGGIYKLDRDRFLDVAPPGDAVDLFG